MTMPTEVEREKAIRYAGNLRFSPPWWDHQRHANLALRRAIEKLLASEISIAPGQCIVDLGCGDRPYERLFAGCRYVACDIDGPADVVLTPGRKSPLPDQFADGLVSFQVLEHVWDLEWYLGEAHRLLKPKGWMLLSTHGTWPYHPHPHDYRRWTRDGLTKEVERFGFSVSAVEGVVGPLAWTTQIRLLGYHVVLRKVPMVGKAGSFLVASVMNARMLLEDAITPASFRDSNACIYVLACRRED